MIANNVQKAYTDLSPSPVYAIKDIMTTKEPQKIAKNVLSYAKNGIKIYLILISYTNNLIIFV